MGAVFTIHPSQPFLATLADALLDGVLIPGHPYRDDPAQLAEVTLFLPTRRAAQAFGRLLVERFDGRALILPTIRRLAEIDDSADDQVDVIAAPDRLIGLAELVSRWRSHVSASEWLSPAGKPIAVPNSAADALYFSRDLGSLLDLATQEGVDWSRLTSLVPEEHAAWWQMTQRFLAIATQTWPAMLTESGRIDRTERQRQATLDLAARLSRGESTGPVVAAGSTGSVPVTAELLKAIAGMEQGAVVLPGLDLGLDEASFRSITENEDLVNHPQATMARLIDRMALQRRDVSAIGTVDAWGRSRFAIMTEALRPADTTDKWPEFARQLEDEPSTIDLALGDVALIEAANEAEEALCVAIALRETLENPAATAALVTPDRGLARRVVAELRRFGIEVNDSAGRPLTESDAGILALLVADIAASGYQAEPLLALAKHPLARFGRTMDEVAEGTRLLELEVLRGPRLRPGGAALLAAAGRKPGGAEDFVRLILDCFAPLDQRAESGSAPVAGWVTATRAVIGQVIAGGDDVPADMVQLDRLLAHFETAGGALLDVAARDSPATLRALLAGESTSLKESASRVAIWGPLEARLLPVDRLVIGGLNEGSWPMKSDSGPWLSRQMRQALGFSPVELRTGLAAHDFVMAIGCRDVILSRSLKSGGAPTTATRYLQRLSRLVGKTSTAALVARGDVYVDYARRIDDRPAESRIARPEPRPPVDARPRQLRVTDIETLIRDPYAIYAKYVLRLKALNQLGELPDFGMRGTVLHQSLARFAKTYRGPMDERAVTALVAAGADEFAKALADYPEVHALWWPRFTAAARFAVLDFEARRPKHQRHAEISGEWTVIREPRPLVLTGRADRIDIAPDGSVSLIDFKTGRIPSKKQIATMNAPQMPLEAVMAAQGAFRDVGAVEVSELVHVLLKGLAGRDKVESYDGYSDKEMTLSLAETIDDARTRMVALARAYCDPGRAYLSRAHPMRSSDRGDYDHLARVAEWSIARDDEGDGE